MIDRVPPQNMEAEQAVLGCMLTEQSAIDTAVGILSADDFYRDIHRFIFEAILEINSRGEPTDLVTVQEELIARRQFESCGGFLFLQSLMDAFSTVVNTEYYCRIVEKKSTQRRLVMAGHEIQILAYEADELTTDQIVSMAESMVTKIADGRCVDSVVPISELIDNYLDTIERRDENKGNTGHKTQFDDYNFLTNGLHPNELTLIAGRPGLGKSSLLFQIAEYHASRHGHVFIFTMEMSAIQFIERMVCMNARVDSSSIRGGYVSPDEWQRIGDACTRLKSMPITVDDSSAMSITELKSKARRIHAKKPISLIAIDYAQLISGQPGSKQNRVQEIDEVSKGLKALAKQLNIPIVALAQLNRAVDGRHDKRPMLSDLRESGSLEANADVVVLMYRDSYYAHAKDEKDTDPFATSEFDTAELGISKNRSGATGTIKLAWIAKYTRFEEINTGDYALPYRDD